jgi:hypothetical protein
MMMMMMMMMTMMMMMMMMMMMTMMMMMMMMTMTTTTTWMTPCCIRGASEYGAISSRLLSQPLQLQRWTDAARRAEDKLVGNACHTSHVTSHIARHTFQVFDIPQWIAAWESLLFSGNIQTPNPF